MIDWNSLANKWNEISEDLRKQIIDAMIEKAQKDLEQHTSKFNDWLLENQGRRDIWLNYGLPEYNRRKIKAPSPAAEAKKIMEAVRPAAPAVATPRPMRILGEEDRKLLLSYFASAIVRGLGRTVPRLNDIFNVEFQEVKLLPFQEARDKILAAAEEVVADFQAAAHARGVIQGAVRERAPPVLRGGVPTRRESMRMPEEEEEGEGGLFSPTGRALRSTYPPIPMIEPRGGQLPMPFPRKPQSHEIIELWSYFCYQLQQKGLYCGAYRREFNDYIAKGPRSFESPEDLHKAYNFFVHTILEGQTLPPLVLWAREATTPSAISGELSELGKQAYLERLENLIGYWASILIVNGRHRPPDEQPTLDDVYDELVDRGVIAASATSKEEFDKIAKNSVRVMYERARMWARRTLEQEEVSFPTGLVPTMFLIVSLEELDAFLNRERKH